MELDIAFLTNVARESSYALYLTGALKARMKAIFAVYWDEEKGQWNVIILEWDASYIFASNFIPLSAQLLNSGTIFLYYTDLTYTLLIIYFGFGCLLSMYGCYHHYIGLEVQRHPRQIAGFWGYSFQITFQMVAAAVVLTDCVFWFIVVPYLAIKDFSLNSLTIALHWTNAVFLLGDAALNSLRFPWFRIAYFLLWTCFYVVFQWIFHACIFFWWPYPFLDLSFSFSPLWYLLVALLHIPCYGVFFLLVKLKHFLLKIFLRDG
ncbi:hypothetical protein L6452_08716 [Arctium lappa]|uniref:Uncharacterized protein n=1 Tax=Arctium lappa TaxID=4217 RepID=A0ACB9DI09_ARCLA|nr:hypothetical protein L6452_08716 [Arctium lappa]